MPSVSYSRIRVIGIGNAFRQDDAVGLCVARALSAQPMDGVDILELQADGTVLFDAWAGTHIVILIDAMCSGSPPGRIFRFDASTQRVPTDVITFSTHAFGVIEAIELARVLGELPERVIMYGIEGMRFEMGTGLSPEVEAAALTVVKAIRDEIQQMQPIP